MFWFLKAYFKGDEEFSYENFYRLPFEYVCSAYSWATKMQQIESHRAERPISLLAAQSANLNRDSKKRKTPFELEDFYLYQPLEEKNLPEARNGASAIWLAKNEMFPAFALFCFPELRKNAGSQTPTIVSYNHPHAILLAPTEKPEGVNGLLIAEKDVSNSIVTMTSPCGLSVRVRIPFINDEVAAEEDVTLLYC